MCVCTWAATKTPMYSFYLGLKVRWPLGSENPQRGSSAQGRGLKTRGLKTRVRGSAAEVNCSAGPSAESRKTYVSIKEKSSGFGHSSHTFSGHTHIYIYTIIYTHPAIHTWLCTYCHILYAIRIHIYIIQCIYIYIHTYLPTYIHTYIHTNIHISIHPSTTNKHTYIHKYIHT